MIAIILIVIIAILLIVIIAIIFSEPDGEGMDTLQRGVQWIGGAVDWGSII